MLSFFLLMLDDDESKKKFNKLYHDYHDKLLSVAMAITKNFYDSEDVLQNVFYIVAKKIKTIKTENDKITESFLCTVVRNASINFCKERQRKAFDSLEFLPEQDNGEDLFKEIEGNEQYVSLVKSIDSLPVIYREVLSLNLLNGLSCRKISKYLSLNYNTVKSRLRKAKKMLQNLIKESEIK